MRYWGTLGETAVRCRWTCGCVKVLRSLCYCMLKAVHWNLSFIFFKLVIYFKQYRSVNDIKWIFVFRQVFYNLLIKISQMMFLRWHFFYFEILTVFVYYVIYLHVCVCEWLFIICLFYKWHLFYLLNSAFCIVLLHN